MAFNDYREPIEYVVNQYFERKRFISRNLEESESTSFSFAQDVRMDLPELPVRLIRDSKGRVIKAVYGELDLLLQDEDADPVVWQEELKRDDKGILVSVITTYPDGEEVENFIRRNQEGKLAKFE